MVEGSPSGWGFMEIMEKFVETAIKVDKFTVINLRNRTSNGYLEYIFRRSAKEIFGVNVCEEHPLNYV